VCPDKLLLPPTSFAYIVSQKVSSAGNISILQFLKENSISLAKNGKALDIQPCKWLVGIASGGTLGTGDGHNRMVAYSQNPLHVRFPLVPMQRTPLEYRGIWQLVTYYGKLGVVETIYPETIGYRDLIS
jgi:hypothetical protein